MFECLGILNDNPDCQICQSVNRGGSAQATAVGIAGIRAAAVQTVPIVEWRIRTAM